MLGKTHAPTGTAAWLAVNAYVVPVTDSGWALAAGAVTTAWAALLPDIDEPGSTASRVLLGPFRRIAHKTILRPLRHREQTHWLVSQLLVAGLAYTLLPDDWRWLAWSLLIGLATHSLGDCITTAGVRWLWPLRITFRLPMRAGGPIETWCIRPLTYAAILWLTWKVVTS